MKLEKGDIIFKVYRGDPVGKIKIDRVTKTQAIAGHTKFRRDYDRGWIRVIGGNTYNMYRYVKESPDLHEKLARNKLINDLKKFDFNDYSTNDLKQVYKILNKEK